MTSYSNNKYNFTAYNIYNLITDAEEVNFLNWPNPSGRIGPGVGSASNRNEYQESLKKK
jgi:hypothetical protein